MSNDKILRDYQDAAISLTTAIKQLKDQGITSGREYNSNIKNRNRIHKEYRIMYLRDIQDQYGNNWQNELLERWKQYRIRIKDMEDGYDKLLMREEILALNKLTLDYKLRQRSVSKVGKYHRPKLVQNGFLSEDIRPFLEWQHGEYDGSEHSVKLRVVREAIDRLTGKQREYAELVWVRGMKQIEAAKLCGVSKSAMSRTLSRARDKIAIDLRSAIINHRQEESNVIDLSINTHWNNIRKLLSDYHLLLFQLYYADKITIEMIANLLHRDRSTIHRVMHRALARLLNYARCRIVIIDNFDRITDHVTKVYTKYINDGTLYEELDNSKLIFALHYKFDYSIHNICVKGTIVPHNNSSNRQASKLSYALVTYDIEHPWTELSKRAYGRPKKRKVREGG